MKQEDSVKVNWELENEYCELVGRPKILEYDYELNDSAEINEISVLDFLPTSLLSHDVKFEDLTCSSTLELGEQEIKSVKMEDEEPCAAAEAIKANIPTPDPVSLSKWRTFISVGYFHPNILAHGDVACLKELFQLMGVDINFGSVNVMIDLGKTVKDYKPVPYLRPAISSIEKPHVFNFAHVKDFFMDMELKVCVVTKYGINDTMKKAATEMTNFIVEYPEALYLELYGFILDFLLKFGVQPEVIIDAVMRTQARRRKCQRPASVLILKKANSLGKGKREFLQQKLLESPEQKYDPVVPIVNEPPPVRTLRNRKAAGGETKTDLNHSPESATLTRPLIASASQCGQLVTTAEITNLNNNNNRASDNLVFAVKRKLFVDDTPETSKTINNDPIRFTNPVDFQNGGTTGNRKKRFYVRRDSNTIDKPFSCNICPNRSFAYKGNLVLHMKKKHQAQSGKQIRKRQENRIPAFSCPVCLQGYASKYKCKAHVQRIHPEHADWPPLCNEDSFKLNKRPAMAEVRRYNAGRAVFRKNKRQSIVPLSETQNSSSSEHGKPSQSQIRCKLNSGFAQFLEAGKQQINGRTMPISTLHLRTRGQFRAAIK